MPARRPSTATSSASRLASIPEAVRRGDGAPLGATSAWTSTSSGREPSSTGATTLPGAGASWSARNARAGSATSISPRSAISNTPTSSVDP